MNEENIEVHQVEPKTKIHTFSETCGDLPVFFQYIQMSECVWIWIGTFPASFSSLSVAIPTKFVRLKYFIFLQKFQE